MSAHPTCTEFAEDHLTKEGEQPIGHGAWLRHAMKPKHNIELGCSVHTITAAAAAAIDDARGFLHLLPTVIAATTTANRWAGVHCCIGPITHARLPALTCVHVQLPNKLPHPNKGPNVDIFFGWADIASMQEQVAHLPDAVRRDRWFDKTPGDIGPSFFFLSFLVTSDQTI